MVFGEDRGASMAIKVDASGAVITPTPWRWYTGAAVVAVLSLAGGAPVGLVAAGFLALTGTGWVNRIVLDVNGFEYRNYWVRKRYAWSEVSDFGARVYRSNFISAAKLITFSEVARRDTLYGKFSRAVAGGTQSMPAIGIDPDKLLELISLYSAHGAHVEPAAQLKAAPRVKPERPKPAPKPVRQPAMAKVTAPRPVELVVDSRTRARQTKGWPHT
jgi:hypothetical protein